jgi:hypothetical protein
VKFMKFEGARWDYISYQAGETDAGRRVRISSI